MSVSLLRSLERFLLPNACVACEQPIGPGDPDRLTCGLCRARLRRLAAGGCPRCQQPLPPVGPCRFCATWPDALTRVRSGVWLDERARRMVHHLKYEGYAALGTELAEILVRLVGRPPGTVLVPIPLHARRERERGYNQAAVLARALGAAWGLPVLERALRRVRATDTQTGLVPSERAANVAGVFAAATPGAGDTEIILIDDVLTTGATLCAAASALRPAGWTCFSAITFARALPFELRALIGN